MGINYSYIEDESGSLVRAITFHPGKCKMADRQLFVAASRVGNPSQLNIAINRSSDEKTGNVVYIKFLINDFFFMIIYSCLWEIEDKNN